MNKSIPKEEIDLTGQVAIVTGGGRGIGRAIALAQAKAGAKVAVAARSADQLAETVALIKEAGGQGLAVPTDVTDQQAVERMVAVTEKELGLVDLLVNNAGVIGPAGPMWVIGPAEWWECMDVNLRGPYLCSRAVLPGMVVRHCGRIINVASNVGLHPVRYGSSYAISKCALIRFSENLAVETKEYTISVFAVRPGFVRTAMLEYTAASPDFEKWFNGGPRKALEAGHGIPPERAANLVLFLASGKADTLSGCFIDIEDDVEEMVRRAEEIQEKKLYTLRLRTE